MEKSNKTSDSKESGFSSSSSFLKLSDNDILKELYEMTLKESDEDSGLNNKNTILSALDNLHLSLPKIEDHKIEENINEKNNDVLNKETSKIQNSLIDVNSVNVLRNPITDNLKSSPLSTRINPNMKDSMNVQMNNNFQQPIINNSNVLYPGMIGYLPYYPPYNNVYMIPNSMIPNIASIPTFSSIPANNQYYYPINYGYPFYPNDQNNLGNTNTLINKEEKKKKKKTKKNKNENSKSKISKSKKGIMIDRKSIKKTKNQENKKLNHIDITDLNNQNNDNYNDDYTINVTDLEKNLLNDVKKSKSNEFKNGSNENETELHSQIIISSSRGGSSTKIEGKLEKFISNKSLISGSDDFAFLNSNVKKIVKSKNKEKLINSPISVSNCNGLIDKSKNYSENKQIKDVPYYINSNKIWEISLLPHGSRKIQKYLTNDLASKEDINEIFSQLLYDLPSVCLNTYGSYVLEKIMDLLDGNQISKFIDCIQYSFLKISIDEVGNRIMQKLITLASINKNFEIITYLASSVIEALCKNKFGEFVIQKVLETFPNNDFIFKFVYYNFHNLISDCYGLLIVKKIIEMMKHKPKEFKISYQKNLWCNIELVIDNKYGHYGLIHMVKEWGIESCLFLIHFIPNNINSICFSIYAMKVCKFIIKSINEENELVSFNLL